MLELKTKILWKILKICFENFGALVCLGIFYVSHFSPNLGQAFSKERNLHWGKLIHAVPFQTSFQNLFKAMFLFASVIFQYPETKNAYNCKPAGMLSTHYMFKVSNRNTRIRCEIFSKLTIKTTIRRQWLTLKIFRILGRDAEG